MGGRHRTGGVGVSAIATRRMTLRFSKASARSKTLEKGDKLLPHIFLQMLCSAGHEVGDTE